jgi:hypothetical protein
MSSYVVHSVAALIFWGEFQFGSNFFEALQVTLRCVPASKQEKLFYEETGRSNKRRRRRKSDVL